MVRSSPGLYGLIVATLFGVMKAAWAEPITFNSALTLSRGEFVVREQVVFDRAGDDPSGAGRERETVEIDSVLGYGVDEKLSLFAVLPYVDKRLETPGSADRNGDGIGDVRLFGRYTAVRRNWTGRAFRASVFAGIETPTGDDDDSDSQGRLPASLQSGSGSWDPFGGLVATYQTLDFQIDGQIAFQVNSEANGFEFGGVFRADTSVQYRLWPREISGGVPGILYGVVEANLVHTGRNETGGIEDANSGGTSLFLAPGFQFVTRRWIVETVVQLPVMQNLNGTALERDFVVRAGFRFNF